MPDAYNQIASDAGAISRRANFCAFLPDIGSGACRISAGRVWKTVDQQLPSILELNITFVHVELRQAGQAYSKLSVGGTDELFAYADPLRIAYADILRILTFGVCWCML